METVLHADEAAGWSLKNVFFGGFIAETGAYKTFWIRSSGQNHHPRHHLTVWPDQPDWAEIQDGS